VAGEVLANVIDVSGRPVAQEFSERALSITLDQLRTVPDVILVASGARRHRAILACLRAGLTDTLITDSQTAQFLLEAPVAV